MEPFREASFHIFIVPLSLAVASSHFLMIDQKKMLLQIDETLNVHGKLTNRTFLCSARHVDLYIVKPVPISWSYHHHLQKPIVVFPNIKENANTDKWDYNGKHMNKTPFKHGKMWLPDLSKYQENIFHKQWNC